MDEDRMRFGLRLIDFLGTGPELVELAVLGEEAGFDSVWFPHDAFMRNTWVTTSAVAMRTRRVDIGGVGINPYTTDPSEIATYAATLDEISGGRCIVGLGIHTGDMVGWTGHDASDRVARTRDAVAAMKALWRGETVARAGDTFAWSDQCYLRFKPKRADIPVYVASFAPDYLALAGEVGDGALPMITPPESARYVVPPIRAGLDRAGRDPAHFVLSGCAWLSLAAERADAAAKMRDMVAYFGPYLEAGALAEIGITPADMAPLRALIDAGRYGEAHRAVTEPMLKLGLVGTPGEVIGQIERLAAMGVDEVNLGGPLGPDPAAAIRLMGTSVIPHFRG
jgi:5,10-methylenetetrahydromethanopterin reductase